MSKKRKRDGPEVDVDLVYIYEQLANEDEVTRLRAAHQLLTQIYRPETTTTEQLKAILVRLFRGLCSGRKAARLGFAVALTELLTEVSKANTSAASIAHEEIVNLLEAQSAVEGGTSGQDERDHYFGRVFGAEAIIKSGILFSSTDRVQWKRLLNSTCSLAQKKPWLRQECGWVLYQLVAAPPNDSKQPFVEDVLKALAAEKIIRTPEGVAVWLAAKDSYPDANLSDHVWKHKHPLARKDVNSLAEIMKDAKPQRSHDEHEAQGAALWSANLHFAWNVVLAILCKEIVPHNVNFKEFWESVVEQGVFHEKSSTERKSSGLLLWASVLEEAPPVWLSATFTRNAVHCLVTSLGGQHQYLRKSSHNVLDTLKRRANTHFATQHAPAVGQCLTHLIKATEFADFDRLTKTNTVAALLSNSDLDVQSSTFLEMASLCFEAINETDHKVSEPRIRYLLELQTKIYASILKESMVRPTDNQKNLALNILRQLLLHMLDLNPHSDEIRAFLHDRLAIAFEQALKHGSRGRLLLVDALQDTAWRSLLKKNSTQFDESVTEVVGIAFGKLDELYKQYQHEDKTLQQSIKEVKDHVSRTEGMLVLYSVVIFEVYCGDTEAAEILYELSQQDASDLVSTRKASSSTDSLLESLLSMSSRSSKFIRTAVATIFESMASGLTIEGIHSLTRVLLSKENAQGQEDMFETADGDEELDDEQDDIDQRSDLADEDSLGSDVEMVNGIDDSAEDSEDSSSDASAEDSDPDEPDDEPNDNADAYAALDAAIASALGTSKPNPDSSSPSDTDADSNISDSEMLALDEKLATVFREHASILTQRKAHKKTQRQTKEAQINFKNRVLDLVEIYFKHQPQNPLCLELVLPILQAIRITQTKQFADRCCTVIREYTSKCKGQNVPSTPATTTLASISTLLKKIHNEASSPQSNAHGSAASQSSLLITKALVKNFGEDGVRSAVEVYSETRTRWLLEGTGVRAQFFTEWNNWCGSVAGVVLGRDGVEGGKGKKADGKGKGKGKGKDRGSSVNVSASSKAQQKQVQTQTETLSYADGVQYVMKEGTKTMKKQRQQQKNGKQKQRSQ